VSQRLAYHGRSTFEGGASGSGLLSLAPNLARPEVAFDAPLARPLRFREAVSALHDVVISDLRHVKRDRTAYLAWKKDAAGRRLEARRRAHEREVALAQAATGRPVAPDLERRFEAARASYWGARRRLGDELRRSDAELWRLLMPYDPIVTIAEDAALFECFSADQSSYGCLSLSREAGFGPASVARPGTTNVDYSWALYERFQALRSYRETRFRIDPAGFGVATEGDRAHREEKIELPAGWLRGLSQILGAMTLPARVVPLSREAVYSLLAVLRRRRARTSPRALRFELEAGKPPRVVLEPWEVAVESRATRYEGPSGVVRIWGRNRLLALARALPLAERVDVRLLGTGLPSFWVVRMGEMALTLGLSGWTANDWSRGSVADLMAPKEPPSARETDALLAALRAQGPATLAALAQATGERDPGRTAAGLLALARSGQCLMDLGAGLFRARSILPQALGEADMGPEPEEALGAKTIARAGTLSITRRDAAPEGGTALVGTVGGAVCEALLDADGVLKKGQCRCSHHFRFGIRKGPCRHIGALRLVAAGQGKEAGARVDAGGAGWYDRLERWARG